MLLNKTKTVAYWRDKYIREKQEFDKISGEYWQGLAAIYLLFHKLLYLESKMRRSAKWKNDLRMREYADELKKFCTQEFLEELKQSVKDKTFEEVVKGALRNPWMN